MTDSSEARKQQRVSSLCRIECHRAVDLRPCIHRAFRGRLGETGGSTLQGLQ